MGWAKFDDQYTDHPKVVAAGPWAELLDMRAVIHCARYETDGHVGKAQLRRLALGIPAPNKKVQALIDAGRWVPDESDGWWVHDFLDYHPSQEQKEKEREEARERMAKTRANKGKNTNRSSDDVRANNERSSHYPDPARPEPPVPDGTEETSPSTDVDTSPAFEEFWNAYPKRDGKRVGKKQALEQWRKLKWDDRVNAMVAIENYANAAADPKVFCPIKDPWRWLKDRLFDDWQEPAKPSNPDRLHNVEQIAVGGRF
jgi:hypothetical protein